MSYSIINRNGAEFPLDVGKIIEYLCSLTGLDLKSETTENLYRAIEHESCTKVPMIVVWKKSRLKRRYTEGQKSRIFELRASKWQRKKRISYGDGCVSPITIAMPVPPTINRKEAHAIHREV